MMKCLIAFNNRYIMYIDEFIQRSNQSATVEELTSTYTQAIGRFGLTDLPILFSQVIHSTVSRGSSVIILLNGLSAINRKTI